MNRESPRSAPCPDDDTGSLLQAILDSATDYAIISTDLNGVITTWNTGAEQVLGWREAEALGQSAAMIFTPEDRAAGVPEGEMARAREHGRAIDERWHIRKDGTRFFGFGELMPLRSAGELSGFVKIFRDRTRQHDQALAAQANAEQLRDSEAHLRLLLDSSAGGFYGVDREGRTTICNVSFLRMMGYEREEEVLGRKLHEVVHHSHPDGSPYPLEACPIYRTAQTGEPVHVPYELFWRASGDSFPVEYWVHPILRGGELTGAICTFNDITERLEAEKARLAAEARASRVLGGMAEGFAFLDRHFRILEVNAEGLRLDNRTREEIVGKTHWEAYPGSEQSELGELYKRALRENVPVSLDHHYVWEDGHDSWLEMRAYPSEEGLAIFYRDVTDRKRVENALRESEERLQIAERAGGVGSFEWRPDTGRLEVSDEYRRIWGISEDAEITDSLLVSLLHPEDKRLSGPARLHSVENPLEYAEYRITRPNTGEERWIARRGETVETGDDSAPSRLVGVAFDITERKRAEEALRESEQRFRAAVHAVQGVLWTNNALGEMRGEQPGWAALTGQRYEDYQGYGWSKAVYPDDAQPTIDAWNEAVAQRRTFEFEHRVRRFDGNWRRFSIRAVPIFASNGAINEWVGVHTDITELRAQEDELRALNETLEARVAERTAERDRLWDLSEDLLVVADYEGRLLRVSPSWARLLGRGEQALLTRPYAEIIHPDDLPAVMDALLTMRATGQPVSFEDRLLCADGTAKWLAWTLSPEPGGERLTGVGRDITAEKAAAEALAARTRERDLVWNTSQDLFVVIGPDSRYTTVNPAWTAILGYSPEELIGLHSSALVHPDDLETRRGDFEPLVRNEAVRDIDLRLRAKDGGYRWFSWTALPAGEGLIYAEGRDVTDRKNLEDQLRQAQKMEAVGQLTGGLAHDFNNLLTGIIGSLELLQKRIDQGRLQDLERYTSAAITSANRAAALTHRLLAFSRRQPLDPKPVDPNRLVVSMEDLLRRTLGESIQFKLVTAGGLWRTLCDPHQLEAAILNLVINARDAMPEGGKLTIETSNAHLDNTYAAREREVKPGQYVCVCVSDTGVGMAPDVIERAFDPFFTTKPIGQGTGLGLSMIYGFARQSEGYAKIYSEVGVGTTVKLYLPRNDGDAEDVEMANSPAFSGHTEHDEVVLVVEDEPAVRDLAIEVLQELGYTALAARDGPEGLKLIQNAGQLDLLITDIGLPGLNGRQLADAARALRPELKVLFMTGYAENAALANGFLEPGMEMITKPFPLESLASRVRQMIEDAPG